MLRSLQGGAALLSLQGVDLLPHGTINKVARAVGVVVRLVCHGKHRAGVDVHYNAHAALRHMMLLHGGSQRTFQPVLQVCIQGQRQAAAGYGLDQRLVVGGHIVAPSVLGSQNLPVLPGQNVIVAQFQPPKPGVVHIGKAQHPAQKIPLGVNALGVLPDLDARGTLRKAPAAHGIGSLAPHPAGKQTVVGGAHAQLLQRVGVVQFQDFAQRRRGGLHKGIVQLTRGGADGPAGFAGSQKHAVGGKYLAPRGGQGGTAQLLVGSAAGVTVGVAQHQHRQPQQQPAEAHPSQHGAEQPRPQAHSAALLRGQKAHGKSLPFAKAMRCQSAKCRKSV